MAHKKCTLEHSELARLQRRYTTVIRLLCVMLDEADQEMSQLRGELSVRRMVGQLDLDKKEQGDLN